MPSRSWGEVPARFRASTFLVLCWIASLMVVTGEGCFKTPQTSFPPGDLVDGSGDSIVLPSDSGVPRKKNGDACSVPDDCQSGICSDEVCCDENCSGVCQSCNLPATRGKCSPLISQEESDCHDLRSCDATGACTQRFTEFPTPTPASGPLTIAVGSDGNLWFTESA